MEIFYSSRKLKKTLTESSRLVRKYGQRQAKEIETQIKRLHGAKTLADISSLPPTRCHELVGNRAGQLSLDLKHPYPLIIEPFNEPIPQKEDGGLDWSQVTRVLIIGVEDTHG